MAQAISKKRKIFDGRYEIIEIVGRGSGSVVYRARHLNNLENEVALKVLLEKKGGGSNSTRLRKEALAMVTSRHPHVIRLDDFHSVDALCYLSMQYAPESDLRKYTKKIGGTLSPEQGERFLTQIVDALAFMHHSNILHRDIKPDNILIINEQEAKLADFGVALLPNQKSSLQELQNGVGTLDYMAPEIFEGTGCDKEADIYLLGVSFYEMLTGHQPFRDVPLVEVLNVRQDDQVTPLQELAPDVPDYLARVIEKAMAYDPLARYRSGEEMYEDLLRQRAAAEQGIVLPESSKPRRERKTTLSVIEGAQSKANPDEESQETVAREESVEAQEAPESVQEHQEQDEAVNSSGVEVKTTSEGDADDEGTARKKRRRRRRRRRDKEQKVVKFFGDSEEEAASEGTPVADNVSADGPDPIAAYTVEEAVEENKTAAVQQGAKPEVTSPPKDEKKGHRFPDPQDPVKAKQEAPISESKKKEPEQSADPKKTDKKKSGTTEMLSQEAEELIAHLEKMLQEDEDFKNLMEENAAKEQAKVSSTPEKEAPADTAVPAPEKSMRNEADSIQPSETDEVEDDFQAAQNELEQVADQSIDEELLAILKEKEPALAAPKAPPAPAPKQKPRVAPAAASAPGEREDPVSKTPVMKEPMPAEQNSVAPGETDASVEVNSWLYQEGSDVKKNSDNVDTIDEVDEIKVASDLYADDELPLEETYEDFSERVSYTAQDDDDDDEGQFFYKPDQQYNKRHMNTANPALNKKHRFIGFLVVIVASIFIGDFYLRSKTNRGLADRAYDIIGYKNSQIVPSVSGQLSFPYMPSGIYTGSIANLIPSLRLPLTLISLQEREKVVVMIGIEGWQPAIVSLHTEPGESIADFRVAANGFVLRMSGKVEGGKIVGTYKNSVTQESGTWEVVPVR